MRPWRHPKLIGSNIQINKKMNQGINYSFLTYTPSFSLSLCRTLAAARVMTLIQLFVAGSLFLLSIVTFLFSKQTRKSNTLPSPPKLPFLGNLHQLGSLLHCSLHKLSQKHGPLMLLHFGQVPTLIISSADMAHEVMKVHDLAFASRPPSSTVGKLMYDYHDVGFAPYGEYWRQVRRICVVHLLNLKRVQSFNNVRLEEAKLMVQKIRSGTQPVNMSKNIIALTNDILCRVAFGRKYSCSNSGGKALAVLLEFFALLGESSVGDFFPWLSWVDTLSGLNARVSNTFRQLDAFLEEVIEDHVENLEGSKCVNKETMDFVDILLCLDATEGISLSRDNIKAIILDMYAAGSHTTFTALEWTMAELIKHPEAMKRVQEEVRGIAGQSETIEEEQLDQMNYMIAVIKESLRMHPPAILLMPRESVEDTQVMGHHIPSKTRVMINAWSIGRDPKSWERAEEFWPDRFMNSSVDFRGQHMQFVPFGAGRRGCPGIDFAVSAIKLALANLLLHFNWGLPDGKKGESLDMSEVSGLTSQLKYDLILEAKSLV